MCQGWKLPESYSPYLVPEWPVFSEIDRTDAEFDLFSDMFYTNYQLQYATFLSLVIRAKPLTIS